MNYSEILSPLTAYKIIERSQGWERSGIESYRYFQKEYFRPKKNPKSDIITNFKFLIPGRIYTYKYNPLYKDELDFYDKRPITLIIKHYIHPNTGNNLQLGINLNFIPREVRVYILESIWSSFKNVISQDLERRQLDDNPKLRQTLLFTDNFDYYGLLEYLLGTIAKTNWKFAIRQYIWGRILNAKFIDYTDWHHISFLESKDIVGISERELLKIYWNNKNKIKKF